MSPSGSDDKKTIYIPEGIPSGEPKNGLYASLAVSLADFSERKVRTQFVIKVLSLMTCMLAITTGIVTIVTLYKNTQRLLLEYPYVAVVAGSSLLILTAVLGCCVKVRQTTPINYILLFVLTAMQSIVLAYVVAAYNTSAVFIALFVTSASIGSVATISALSKYDFTGLESVMCISGVILLIVQIAALVFMPTLRSVERVIGGAGALLFCLYIALDIHLLLNSETSMLYPDDYVGALIMLYIDFINIFFVVLLPRKRKDPDDI